MRSEDNVYERQQDASYTWNDFAFEILTETPPDARRSHRS